MKAEILYISSRSHVNLWRPINIQPVSSAPEGFIFSTHQLDKVPQVIIDLNLPNGVEGIEIEIWNRDLSTCRERALGLKVFSSKDFRQWRNHEISYNHPFIYNKVPLKLGLGQGERFLLFEIANAKDYFHLGGINISASCHFGKEVDYDYEFYRFAQRLGDFSNSQRLQDIFALYNCGFHSNFFLEFGVADGVRLSNTLLLEVLGWQGIVGEALNSFYTKAKKVRTCIVIEGALSSESGKEIEFFESGLISSSVAHASSDMHLEKRQQGKRVRSLTNRIDEILDKHQAPSEIGYFSLDVEGAELEVLETFPFERYQLKCASIEHNYTDQEEKIDKIMSANGFRRVLKRISGHDGFYVHKSTQRIDWNKTGFAKLRKHSTAEKIIMFCRNELGV